MSEHRGIDRRQFLATAVAIGGSAALSACLGRDQATIPTGPTDLSGYPDRQHAWNAVLPTDDHGNVLPPRHRVILLLDLPGTAPPTDEDRSTVATALEGVEHAYERSGDGLLMTVSYGPTYFDRYADPLPNSIDLPPPEALSSFEDPVLDDSDAVIHLASNHAAAVLGAEEALRGTVDAVNGVDQPGAALTDVFTIRDRHTGFVGAGLPADHDDVTGVPEDAIDEDAPLYMGFKSGFEKNQASEDSVTITEGPFAGGTTQHFSTLRLDLERWYEQDDRWQREAKMFCPHHAETNAVEDVGNNLGDDSGVDACRDTDRAAREMGVVGHTQKTADARQNGEPLILRRDFNSTDGGHAGLHFVAVQASIEDFVATREAMNGVDIAADSAVGQRTNNGILQYVQTLRRGNFLVPPRQHRVLPTPNPP
ncbi:MAG: Tat pathway signal protein [Halobacteriaceae archaeon]